MEIFKGRSAEIINTTFQSLLVTYLLLLLIEQIWPGFVSLYLNLNYLLAIVVVAGILDVFSYHQIPKKKRTTWKDYVFIITLAIAGFIIIKFKTVQLGWLSWLISIIAGILIFLLSQLILDDEKKEEEQTKPLNPKLLAGIIIAILLIISIVLPFVTPLAMKDSLRIVFGSVYVLFLPGFLISYLFFRNKIDYLERTALSFALSIAVVPLVVFYLNLIGMKISIVSTFFTVLGIILLTSVILYWKEKKHD